MTYSIALDMKDFPGVNRWIDIIEKRDAVQKGVKVGLRKSLAESKNEFSIVRILRSLHMYVWTLISYVLRSSEKS